MNIFKKTLPFLGVLLAFQTSSALAAVRDITFESLSINTMTQGPELYNNGRMQKPIVIKYSAYLFNPMDIYNHDYVKLTVEEESYYLKLAEFGETAPQNINLLHPQFSTVKTKNKYSTNLQSASRSVPRTNASISYYESKLYLSYKGDDKDDVLGNINLCVFANPERRDQGDAPISGYPGTNCVNDRGADSRQVNVISGAYASYIEENSSDRNTIDLSYTYNYLCSSVSECYKYRITDGDSFDLRDIDVDETQFSSKRPNHILQAVDSAQSHLFTIGCMYDSYAADGDRFADGICSTTEGWDYYMSWGVFGDDKGLVSKYSTRHSHNTRSANIYKPYTNRSRAGKFTVLSVKAALSGSDLFVKWSDDEWAGNTFGTAEFNQLMEDNFGNRFTLEARFFKDGPAGESDQSTYTRLDKSSITLTPIY